MVSVASKDKLELERSRRHLMQVKPNRDAGSNICHMLPRPSPLPRAASLA